MRTTVTLDPDVEILVKQAMRTKGLSFKQALNQAIRAGLVENASVHVDPFHQRRVALGRPRVEVTKALALSGELEDQHTIRRHRAP